MLDFESARVHFISAASALGCEEVPLGLALNRVLAERIVAPRAVPPFPVSAMDGYALRVDGTFRVPYRLAVTGEAAAGSAPATLCPGTAFRIFTGAPVPEGANAVVMQEHVVRQNDEIYGDHPVAEGQNIRQCGEDLPAFGLALEPNVRIHPGTLALASFLDCTTLTVRRAPLVAILCTGNELRPPGTTHLPGSIAESNSMTIAALARQAGAVVDKCSLVADDAKAIHAAVESALERCNVLVTIGGVSVGDYDYVRPALERAGVAVELHQVGIKPGKPITLGRRGDKLIIGLPGNPASAIVTFALFGMPLLRAMQGDSEPIPLAHQVKLGVELKADARRTRAVLGSRSNIAGNTIFTPHRNQSSATTIALGQSEGLVIVASGDGCVARGATLPFHRWTEL